MLREGSSSGLKTVADVSRLTWLNHSSHVFFSCFSVNFDASYSPVCSHVSVCHLKVLFIGYAAGAGDSEGGTESVDTWLVDSVCPHENNKSRQSKYEIREFIFTTF